MIFLGSNQNKNSGKKYQRSLIQTFSFLFHHSSCAKIVFKHNKQETTRQKKCIFLSVFGIGNAESNYTLTAENFTGTAGSSKVNNCKRRRIIGIEN